MMNDNDSFKIFLEIRCDDAGIIINYLLFIIYLFMMNDSVWFTVDAKTEYLIEM